MYLLSSGGGVGPLKHIYEKVFNITCGGVGGMKKKGGGGRM